MKAIVLTRYGMPQDVLRLEDREVPTPARGEVLVKVHATAVNDWDWCLTRGKPHVYRLLFGLSRPKVLILGAELAGTVEAVGEGVAGLAVGDAVFGDVSEAGFGGFAEYVCVRSDALGKKPSAMTFEQAASLPHAAMLALQGLVDVGRIKEGEKVLINGAGGGVGTIGVQIARRSGATVTGVDSARKLDMLRSLGFDRVIDYRERDFAEEEHRYDLILDTRSTRPTRSYLRCLEPGGRYVTVGGEVSRLVELATVGPWLAKRRGKQVSIVALKPNRGLDYITGMFESVGLRTVIDGPYPLADVPRLVQRFGDAEHLGKIVVRVC